MGNLATANSIKYPGQAKFVAAPLEPYNVNGIKKGEFKQADNMAYLNIFEAGHEAAYYRKFPSCFCCDVMNDEGNVY